LPTVVRWNKSAAGERYAELARVSSRNSGSDNNEASEELALRLEELAAAGGLRTSLSAAGIEREQLPELAGEAAKQWTGGFNPRAFDQAGALEVYRAAF